MIYNMNFLLRYKKFFSLFLSIVVLLNLFSFVSKQNKDLSFTKDIYSTSTVSVSAIQKYYSLLPLLPIRVISKVLDVDSVFSNSVCSEKNSKSKKESNKNTKTLDFSFDVYSYVNLNCAFSKFLKHSFLISNNLNINKSFFEFIFYEGYRQLFFVFNGCMILARGDIEDNIVVANKIENKVIRLV